MDDVQELKNALPEDLPKLSLQDLTKLSKRERRELFIGESLKIFREKFYTDEEKERVREISNLKLPTAAKCNPPPTFFLPDFVSNEHMEDLTRMLTLLPEARKIHKELYEKYFPRKKDEPVGEVVKVKSADLQKFMAETLLPRPKAEKFLLRARGDLKAALELFVRSGLESDSDNDADWDLDLKLLC